MGSPTGTQGALAPSGALDQSIFSGNRWLEIKVGGDAPLMPRQQFVPVAFAFEANTVPDGAITNAKIASVDYSKILNAPTSFSASGPAGGDLVGSYPNPSLGFYPFLLYKVSGGVMISSNNNIGIGMQPSNRLDVAGNVQINGNLNVTGQTFNISDGRYKAHIQSLPNALDTILSLRGVTYDFQRSNFEAMNFPQSRQIGFVAQELEQVLPELVHTGKDGYKAIAYTNIIPVLVEGMKAQQKQIMALKAQTKEAAVLKKQVADLTALVEQMEKKRNTKAIKRK